VTAAPPERHAPRQLPASLHAADQQGAVYVTHYPLPSVAVSLDGLKSIRGIICAHVVRGEQPPLLCIYWRSRHDCERDEPALLARMGTNLQQDARRGFVSSFTFSGRRWSWQQVVTFLFALLGAWQTLLLLGHYVYKPGDILITAGRAGAIDYFPEQQLIESFRITSRLPIEQSVLVEKIVLKRGGISIREATYAPKVVKGLGTNQSETIQLSVPLPEEPGEYEIVATTQAKAGWFPGPRPRDYTMPVKIWSPVPHATFEGWSDVQPDTAAARYRLDVGYAAPAGLDCTVTVTGAPPEITAIMPKMAGAHGAGELVTAGEGQLRVVSQSWTTRPFPDFAKTTVRIVLHSASSVDWQRLPTDRLQFHCSPRMERPNV
jgi:hypothetical protein